MDASELALQLHHYLDGLNDEAVRDFAVVFATRLPAETRSLLFTTLEEPAESELRSTLRGAEAQRLKFAMSSVLWIDQSAFEAIPDLVQESMATHRAFVITDDFAEVQPRRRRILPYAGIAIVAGLTLFVMVNSVQRTHFDLRIPQWLHRHAHAAAAVPKPAHHAVPSNNLRIAISHPSKTTSNVAKHRVRDAKARRSVRHVALRALRSNPVAAALNDVQRNAAVAVAPPVGDDASVNQTDADSAVDAAESYVTQTNPGVAIQSAKVVQKTSDGAVVEVVSNDDGASITDRIILSVNALGYTVQAQQRAGSASTATSRACFDGRQWKECSGGG